MTISNSRKSQKQIFADCKSTSDMTILERIMYSQMYLTTLTVIFYLFIECRYKFKNDHYSQIAYQK